MDVCFNDPDNPIVGFKRQKNEVNWRDRLLSLDADGILTVRSMIEELEESSGLEEDFLLLLFCCWLKHWREASNESEVGVVFGFLMWLDQAEVEEDQLARLVEFASIRKADVERVDASIPANHGNILIGTIKELNDQDCYE